MINNWGFFDKKLREHATIEGGGSNDKGQLLKILNRKDCLISRTGHDYDAYEMHSNDGFPVKNSFEVVGGQCAERPDC